MAKYKIIPSTRTIVHSPISIGHKTEKGVEAIEFDLTAWVETYGSGTLTVIMRRWGDAIPYPIALEIDENNKATWTLSDIDTAKAGMAYAQLNYIVGDEVVKKSDIYTFRVMDSLTGEGEPPEAYESWLEHLTHLAAEAMAEVLDIEGVVTDKTLTVDGGIADAKATGDALALKADKSTTYTKTEVDQMIEDVEVETDTTLSVSGAPADAKKTGDELSALKADLVDVYDTDINVGSITNGYYVAGTTGNIETAANSASTDFISVIAGSTISFKKVYLASNRSIFAYDVNKNPLYCVVKGSADTTLSATLADNVAYIRITSKTGETPEAKYANGVVENQLNAISAGEPKQRHTESGNPLKINGTLTANVEGLHIYGCKRNARPTPDRRVPVGDIVTPHIFNGGKNLLSKLNSFVGTTSNGVTITVNSDKSITVSGTATAATTIKVGTANLLAGHTYTLHGVPTVNGGCYMHVSGLPSGNPSDRGNGAVFTPPATVTVNIYVNVPSGFNSNITIYPQIELGTKKTDYETYKGKFVELTGITMKPFDDIYKSESGWVLDAEGTTTITLDGDEDLRTTGKGYYVPLTTWDWSDGRPYAEAVCDAFSLAASWDDVATGRHDNIFIVYKNEVWSSARAAFFSTRWNNLSDFQTWLSNNPITFSYKDGSSGSTTQISGTVASGLDDIMSYDPNTVICMESPAYVECQMSKVSEDIAEDYMTSKADYKRPIITIIDDDGQTAAYTVLKPLCDAKGIKCTMALITSFIGNNESYMTLAQVLSLKNAGYDLVSHSNTHTNSVFSKREANFSLVTDEAILSEFKQSRDWLVKYGLNDKVIVYPHGNFPEFYDATCNNPDPNDQNVCGAYNQAKRYAKLARDAGYDYGVNSSGGFMTDHDAYDDMYIPRAEVVDADGITYWQDQIDRVVDSNGWMIIITHMWSNVLTSEFLGNLIDYAIANGCTFMTFADAVKYKRNSVSVGMYGDSHSFYVGRNGQRS